MPTTTNRARLEDWFAAVDRLLTDGRPHAISPSSTPPPSTREVGFTVTVGSIGSELTVLLDQLVHRPGRWIVVLQPEGSSRYCQAICFEDGSVVAEAVSNAYLKGDERLSGAKEAVLEGLGWERPENPGEGNWSYLDGSMEPDVDRLAVMVAGTFVRVLGCAAEVVVEARLFSSSRRGRTAVGAACW